MTYSLFLLKRFVEHLFIYPFILAGRLIAHLNPLQKEYRVFYFFPFYHTGGAEKVHAEITEATGGNDCMIYFTRRSSNNRFLDEFKNSGCQVKDISKFTDNKWIFPLNLIYRGIISGYINRQSQRSIVFNGQSNFGYKISPWLNKKAVQVELIHALNTFSLIRIPYFGFYKKNITVSQEIIDKHAQLYKRYHVPEEVFQNFTWIRSRIDLPEKKASKDYFGKPLQLLFAGRDSIEKRPAIVAQVARKLKLAGINATVGFAGDVSSSIPVELHSYCRFYGDINDKEQLNDLYSKAHILLIPSTTESGPLVLMEAMAFGTAIISTDVGYVPTFVKDGVSGFIVRNSDRETKIIDEMTQKVIQLDSDRNLLKKMGEKNIEIAFENFDITQFHKEYQQLFGNLLNNEAS